MRRMALAIAGLAALLTALDQLYRVLHPEVNGVRAGLVGLTAWIALAVLARRWRRIPVRAGALAVFASASGSVLLIESGVLVSRSAASALVHVLILAAAWAWLGPTRMWGAHCGGAAPETESTVFLGR